MYRHNGIESEINRRATQVGNLELSVLAHVTLRMFIMHVHYAGSGQ